MTLDCQSLSHHSDFDTTSESGLSELSLILPPGLKKPARRSRYAGNCGPRVVRRGARVTRRHENDSFLNTLTVITEIEREELAAWPEYTYQDTAFTQLFENECLRAAWDEFIQLSETEQARLLNSFHRHAQDSGSDSEVVCESDTDREIAVGALRWRPNRRARKAVVHSDSPAPTQEDQTITPPKQDIQKELRGCLPTRFVALLSRSIDVAHGHHRRSRKAKRVITPLDFCLINRVETELRRWFEPGWMVPLEELHDPRWTPTVSLLSDADLRKRMLDGDSMPELLKMDTFERLLVHCVSSYLGLHSYSTWSDCLKERQLWVDRFAGIGFNPPPRTLSDVLRSYFV